MKIKIWRPDEDSFNLFQYYIVLDGNQIGQIERGEEKTFEVSDEEHELYIKEGWCTSNSIKFGPNEGDKRFKCNFRHRDSILYWCNSLIAIYRITFGRKRYYELTDIS
jgi:hypothetical protein